MASEALDQASVFDEFNRFVTASLVAPLRPHITGPQAALLRYGVAAEKPTGLLGSYTGSDTTYNFPAKPAGSLLDSSYTKLWIDNAKLRYYSDAISAGDTIAPVSNYPSRVRAAATRFKSNTAAARSASFLDRDVTIGDLVRVTDGSTELWSKVIGFVPEVIASSIGSATADSGNVSTQSLSSSISQTSGTVNDITATRNVAAYSGLKNGAVNETYTITVIQAAGTPGDATTARLSVTSSSGKDNQSSITPAAYGKPTPIGTGGALVTFSRTSSDFVLGQVWTLTIAQAFTAITGTSGGTYTGTKNLRYIVTVLQGGVAGATNPLANPTTQATVDVTGGGSSGGTLPAGTYYVAYTFRSAEGETTLGTSESNQITVSSGNIPRVTLPSLPTGAVAMNVYLTNTNGASGTARLFARSITGTTFDLDATTWDGGTFGTAATAPGTNTAATPAPTISAVDTTGVDASGPTAVGGSLAVAVGSFGVTLTFSGAKLRAGDKYTILATAATDGAIQTLVLADNLPSGLQSATDLTLSLYIPDSKRIPSAKPESPGNYNWTQTATTLTVKGGMTAYDPTWTNGGVQQALPVEAGTLYVEYRAWLSGYAGKVTTITDSTTLVSVLGPNHPDNPLAYAVGKALANVNGQGVRFTAVANPDDTTAWTEVLTILDRYEDVYALVPLTRNQTIIDAWKTHVTAQSTADVSHNRVVLSSLLAEPTYAVVNAATTADLQTALGTLADNPAVSGTQYTLLTCTGGNADFLTKGVRAGDTLRFLYGLNSAGESIWTEFLVASVVNEDQLVIETGHSAAVPTPQRFEIWRTRTRSEIVSNLTSKIAAGANSRWLPVWPDKMLDGSLTVEGYFLCAAIAGLTGGIPPHQSLKPLSVSGFSGIATEFNNGQLLALETAGCITVDKTLGGTIYIRMARTSDQTSLTTGEEYAIRSLDFVVLNLANKIRSLYGTTNVVQDENQGAAFLVKGQLQVQLDVLRSGTIIERLGGAIVSGTVDLVRPNQALPDHLNVQVTVTRPFALGRSTLLVIAGVG